MTTILNKNLMKAAVLVAFLTVGAFSCKKKDDTTTTTAPAGTVTVSGEITADQHWTADQHILLSGYVYVTSGVTLTIDAGTIIKGDKASKGTLIIERGAKINAVGTSSNPIIFTSNQAAGSRTFGDWGGVILCGYAPNNWVAAPKTDGTTGTVGPAGTGQVEGGPRSLYGGTNSADNSGTLSYVRIEFGGVAFSPNNEINGLTLCSVGSGTQIDHIQVSYSGDDAYEWFGGNVNCNHLVAHKAWDDDFDTDNGFSGMVQFGMIYRDPYSADQSGSHTFESDSRNETSSPNVLPLTQPVFSNITAVGPLTSPSFNGYNPNFVCGMVLRRSSALSIFNSMIIGYPLGIIIDEDGAVGSSYGSTYDNITSGKLKIKNTAVIGCPPTATSTANPVIVSRKNDAHSTPNSVALNASTTDSTFWTTSGFTSPYQWFKANNNYVGAAEGTTSRLTNAFNGTNPNFVPSSTSYTVYNITTPSSTTPTWTADFSDAKLSGATSVNYIGAFGTDRWTDGWTNFDPVNADYGSAY